MNSRKRKWLIFGLIALSICGYVVGRLTYVWWHIPEAYAAWDAGDMLLSYMRTHDNDWPNDWDELQAAVESEPALFLRGRHPDEPNYMERMRRTIKIDWTFDPSNPENPTPVTRADGSQLHSYWVNPNGMIYRYLDRENTDEPSDARGVAVDGGIEAETKLPPPGDP